MGSAYELCDCSHEVSELADALSTEASRLSLLAKAVSGVAAQRALQLARKSAEICRLARRLHSLISNWRTQSRRLGGVKSLELKGHWSDEREAHEANPSGGADDVGRPVTGSREVLRRVARGVG